MFDVKQRDISLTPSSITPTLQGSILFGIKILPMELSRDDNYYFKEPNGVIRQGITREFLDKYKEYFNLSYNYNIYK